MKKVKIYFYPNSTVPTFAVKRLIKNSNPKRYDIGVISYISTFCNANWINKGHADETASKAITYRDLNNGAIYHTDKINIFPLSEQEWNDISPEKKGKMFQFYYDL